MRLRSLSLLAFSAFAATFLFTGCKEDPGELDCPEEGSDYYSAETEIGALYEFCYGSNEECRDYEASLLLYLDTNFPPPEKWDNWISLSSLPSFGTRDHVAFSYQDTIPSDMYEQMLFEPGWKASIVNARIEFCETCYTNCGLAKIIGLTGDPASVGFIFDPEDSLGIYIEYSPIE